MTFPDNMQFYQVVQDDWGWGKHSTVSSCWDTSTEEKSPLVA